MIDTDKYEGHLAHLEYELWAFTDFMDINATHEERCATDALLNDAPLLLAEVKRLREENKELEEFLNESHASNKIWHERLIRAQKWAYKQVCHNDSAMMDFDDYVWGEKE